MKAYNTPTKLALYRLKAFFKKSMLYNPIGKCIFINTKITLVLKVQSC